LALQAGAVELVVRRNSDIDDSLVHRFLMVNDTSEETKALTISYAFFIFLSSLGFFSDMAFSAG
jgi:hypothetical protein